MSGFKSRFDWYSATFENFEEDRIPSAFAVALGGTLTVGRGNMGYAHCTTVERDGKSLARIFTGSPRPGEIHVSVSGDACDQVVPFLRRMWPEHRVSRADSAMDFKADFEDLDGYALAFAKENGLSHRMFTDSDGGATRYIGAASSESMVRLYKKSEQLRKMHPDQASEIEDGIVRAEMVTRPNSKMKPVVATMSPDAIWGLGEWTQKFAGMFLDLETERVSTHFRRTADWSRALHWMGQQYGPTAHRRIQQVGLERAQVEILEALGMSNG